MDTLPEPQPEPSTDSSAPESRTGDQCPLEESIIWHVTGGTGKGGIIVREGEALTSPQTSDRLATGSVVKQLHQENGRLHYECIQGSGPKFGWVSLQLNNKALLTRLDQAACHPTLTSSTNIGWTKSLILFDWDDTLCPTTWIGADPELRNIPRGMQPQTRTGKVWDSLLELSKAVKELLCTAQSFGAVAVVTLAERPWVSESAQTFIPEVSHLLEKLSIFYAREEPVASSKLGLNRFVAQKRSSMQKAMDPLNKRFCSTPWLSLISIGDSEVERAAAQELGKACQTEGILKFTKTIKFRERPNVEQLLAQIQLLKGHLANLVASENQQHVNVYDL